MINVSMDDVIGQDEVLELYCENHWSSAEKPDLLMRALRKSDALVTARLDGKLVGLANAISDGCLVVYYPHMLVHPTYHGRGIGRKLMEAMQTKYAGFHQQMLTADCSAVGFYKSLGFEKAGMAEAMWIYGGNEH
ncbi:GNAT family N-acetyltransferase [Neptunomonas japonica]|uniref:GCN5 family acetyltransferase n=1 Tax=Neptunomonas japonica JAMM 1380 TaxID=1441457 RepID=A0A7R6PIQ5_9GAMM|nr:GNAT family N-acetyltransferase [Neptunomonas japonica]BBB30937.1 GCN5 family acetyltransferase [Neptunomonas japonica JAMM 1380]